MDIKTIRKAQPVVTVDEETHQKIKELCGPNLKLAVVTHAIMQAAFRDLETGKKSFRLTSCGVVLEENKNQIATIAKSL